MRIENKTLKNPKSAIRNPKWKGRCFFRATPFLPGHKLAFKRKENPKLKEGKKFRDIDESAVIC